MQIPKTVGWSLWAALAVMSCGPSSGGGTNDNGNGVDGAVVIDGSQTVDGGVVVDGGTTGDGGLNCQPPDMLIVLDRTMSMHREPNGDPAPQDHHELSKWYLAIGAIEDVTSGYDTRLRFGLELFPRDPGGNVCVTLTERIDGTTATNQPCEEGEVVVTPDLGTAAAIDAALDPESTRLCTSTPIGAAMQTALDALSGIQDPVRDQYALLVTDGQDTCHTPDPIERTQALAAAGVRTFVLGFDASGTGVDSVMLNNAACAGLTAPDQSTNCVQQGTGWVAADPQNGPLLYISASNGSELKSKIENVAASVGCEIK